MTEVKSNRKLPSISLISWALNEEENVINFLRAGTTFCQAIANDFEIIVIDDGSGDRTLGLLQSFSKENPSLKYFSNGQNRGVGFSMKRAIQESTKEYVIWQTQDWSYDLQNFNNVVHESELRPQIIHGIRELGFSLSKRSDNRFKAFVSICNYLTIRTLFRAPFRDFQNVTLYPREVVEKYSLQSDSSFTSPELLLRAWNDGYEFLEIPVIFQPREFGVAKGTRLTSILKSIHEILYFRIFFWPRIRDRDLEKPPILRLQ
jgi:dolichol-phosphate mannosyltransferase